MRLDSTKFGVLRSNILAIEPLPNLNKVYAMILREERQKNLSNCVEARTMVEGAAIKAMVTRKNRQACHPWCSNCHKIGHEKSQSFEIIGYPPNWQAKGVNWATPGQNRMNTISGLLPRNGKYGYTLAELPINGRSGHTPIRIMSFAGRKGGSTPASPTATNRRLPQVWLQRWLMPRLPCLMWEKKRRGWVVSTWTLLS